MNFDWKELIRVAINKGILIGLATLAARYTQWTDIIAQFTSGQNVSFWNGAVVFNLAQVQFWLYTGAIFVTAALIDWWKKVKLKRAANIALQLPRGATSKDVELVAVSSPAFSAFPNSSAVSEMVKSIKR